LQNFTKLSAECDSYFQARGKHFLQRVRGSRSQISLTRGPHS